MLELTENLRFYFYNGKTNMRGGYRRLRETIRTGMKADPENASNVHVLMNRRCTIVRMLHYERGFYVLYEKRPSQGASASLCSTQRPADTKSATVIFFVLQKDSHVPRSICGRNSRRTKTV